jgi:hypothetical protein
MTTKITVHPNCRRGYAFERLRKAAQIGDVAARQKFLEEALEKYRAWALGLGAAPNKVAADVAILRCQFFPNPQRRQA